MVAIGSIDLKETHGSKREMINVGRYSLITRQSIEEQTRVTQSLTSRGDSNAKPSPASLGGNCALQRENNGAWLFEKKNRRLHPWKHDALVRLLWFVCPD